MKTKIILIILGIFLIGVVALVSAQGNITNLSPTQPLPNFTAGETVTTVFEFEYPDNSTEYPNQIEDAPLVFIVNISSNNSNYPVWKGDFELNGSMKVKNLLFPDREYNFECSETEFELDYPYVPIDIDEIPDGIFYCSNEELLAMDLDSENEATLEIKSHPALWPGTYYYEIGLFYPELAVLSANLTIYSPTEGLHRERRLQINITSEIECENIEYIEWNDRRPRWRRFCRECNEYGFEKKKTRTFEEGENNVSFRCIDQLGNTEEKNVSFFVDSKKPRISKTEPRRNEFTNGGNFYIKFKEDNIKELLLTIVGNHTANYSLNYSECVEKRGYKECYFDINIDEFDGQQVEYWFNVSDFVRSAQSRAIKINADTTSPVINNNIQDDLIRDRGRVTFRVNVTEENFDEVFYKYIDDRGRLKEKRLCSRLKDGICSKKKTFSKGIYNLTIIASDKAGNSDEQKVNFKM